MTSIEKRVGAQFREARKASGLTQEELAERLGVATETIGRLERGVQLPALERLEVAAQALGVELADLLRPPTARSRRERAISRLVSALRARAPEDAELVADLADRIFRRWA